MSFLALIISVIVAMFIGILAKKIVPFHIPGGTAGAMIAGFVGAWIGHGILGTWGPVIAGFALFPALTGAVIFVSLLSLIGKFI